MLLNNILLIASLLLATNCYALVNDESTIIPDFTEQSIPVVNNLIADQNRRLQSLENSIDNLSTGIVSDGGTGLTATTDDTVLVGYNSTTYQLKTLPNCPSGTLAYTQATNTFSCATNSFSLISATSFSAATETSDISISTGKTYKVIIDLQQASSASSIKIIFNNDTSGNNYQYFYSQYAFEATPTQTKAGSAGTNDIVIVPSMNSTGRAFIEFYIATTYTTNQIRVVGTSSNESSAGPYVSTDFSGIYDGGTCSSFDISTTAGTFTGTVYLYELSHS